MMKTSFSEIIESYYLETVDGLYFAVKGLVHPPDRIVAILRYLPGSNGERTLDGRSYRRVYHFDEQEQILQSDYPEYISFDPVYQATLQSVPRRRVRRVYDPRTRLQGIARQSQLDPVEADTLAFALLLRDEAGIPLTSLGVSGSLLIGLHTQKSDLDMTVHGKRNCQLVHRALTRLLVEGEHPEIKPFDREGLQKLYQERVVDTHMSFDDFIAVESGKVFQGKFRDRTYFIRFLKEPSEIGERYGDIRYIPVGQAGITATVSGNHESIFTPCLYPLSGVHFQKGPAVTDLKEIVSYRGRFCEQAKAGDSIYAFGTVERVQTRDGRVWHRLLLGNHPEDTMLPRR